MKDVEAEIWNYDEDFTTLIRQSGHLVASSSVQQMTWSVRTGKVLEHENEDVTSGKKTPWS